MLLQIYNYKVSGHGTNHIRNTNKIRINLINVSINPNTYNSNYSHFDDLILFSTYIYICTYLKYIYYISAYSA